MTVIKSKHLFLLVSHCIMAASWADTVLVQVGAGQVTDRQLEMAMQAAPFATQFPAMDEKDQAYLRGDMLLRLARAEALYQEAVAQGKRQSPLFQQELNNFRTGLLAQRYLDSLRNKIKVPADIEKRLRENIKGQSDAISAARSTYIAKQFAALKQSRLDSLKSQAEIKVYLDRLNQNLTPDTILAEAADFKIKYGDMIPPQASMQADPELVKRKTNEWLELMLLARAAIDQGINIDQQLQDYAKQLSIRMLLIEKEQQWLPDEQVLWDYFRKQPQIGYIPERRQIGQIVVESRAVAEQLRRRIMAGESLFNLAAQYSIDPYGRQHSGDMGWLKEGSGAEAIEQVLKDLPDHRVSGPIKTTKGWHLVMIVDRKPSEQKDFAAVKDRVRQKLIAEKMKEYLETVTAKYPLEWKINDHLGS